MTLDQMTSQRRIWRLQYGPCWCRHQPGGSSSFDFLRFNSTPVDNLDQNILIVSDRVMDGSRPSFVDAFERVPGPKLTVAVAVCPATEEFWDGLGLAWSPVGDILPIDTRVAKCIDRHPEALLAGVLSYRGSPRSAATNSADRQLAIQGEAL